MEVVQGKSTDQKVVVAQEIAFAKILAGNNKTLRDRALKKLKRWLTIRGNGKQAFKESDFIRISTGLFYCMWMSDKYLVQEELAESISQLIHCFEKNSEGALLFIRCFFKRLLMEWEGLDQYRVDKFNMLVRRFLRQSLVYCKRRQWDKSILSELTKIFYNVVLHKNNCLGFVLHFISIYAEEIAKVSKGKLRQETVLTLIEPLVKVMAKSKDERIQQEISYFFDHLIKQTDVGLEFEDRFNAWKQQGFPGTGPECMKREIVGKKKNVPVEDKNDEDFEIDDDDDDDERLDEALDPRAGSVDVFLPQIPIDPDAVIALLKKYENTPHTIPTGKKKLRTWIHKLYAIKKGRFPAKFKKDLILEQKNKKRSAVKKAKKLLEFTQSLYEGPVRTKELKAISRELESYEGDEREKVMELDEDEEMSVEEDEDEDEEEEEEADEDEGESEGEEEEEEEEDEEEDNVEDDEEDEEEEEDLEEDDKPNPQVVNKTKTENKKGVVNGLKDSEQVSLENNKKAKKQKVKDNNRKCFINPYAEEAVAKMAEEGNSVPEDVLNHMKENKKQFKRAMKNHEMLIKAKIAEEVEKELRRMAKEVKGVFNEEEAEPKKKRVKLVKISNEKGIGAGDKNDEGKDSTEDVSSTGEDNSQIVTPVKRRKILSSWQVQELDTSSPEYYKIKIPKTIKLEKKTREGWDAEENHEPEERNGNSEDVESEVAGKVKEEFTPVFWEKAKAKAGKNLGKSKNKDIVMNPYAVINNESKSPGLRRISFALDRNMAQENDEYLEEVKNSPKVPFDGSKKPSQGVLKSGLSPSPVNPFYRFKRIKF